MRFYRYRKQNVRLLSQSDFLQDHLLHFHSNHPVVRGPFNTGYPASLNVFVNSFTFSSLPTEKQYAHILLFVFVMHHLSLPAS